MVLMFSTFLKTKLMYISTEYLDTFSRQMVLLQFSSSIHNLSSVCILVNFHVTLLHTAIFYRLLTVQALQVTFASLNFASFVSLLLT